MDPRLQPQLRFSWKAMAKVAFTGKLLMPPYSTCPSFHKTKAETSCYEAWGQRTMLHLLGRAKEGFPLTYTDLCLSLLSSMWRWWPLFWCKAHSFPEHLLAQVEFLLGQMQFTCVTMKCSFLGNIRKVNYTSHSQSPFEFFLILLSLSCNRSDVKEDTGLSKIHISGNTCSVALLPWSLYFISFKHIYFKVFCWRQRNKLSSFLLQPRTSHIWGICSTTILHSPALLLEVN